MHSCGCAARAAVYKEETNVDEKKLISVIVPCYNEQEVLPMFYKEITKVSAQMQEAHPELTFEYLFIDDGSKDRTLRTLRIMAKYDKRVRYISFSRNFGKEAGIYAGLQNAKGDYCVVMDADLQHPPAFLPKMYEAVAGGRYDCATTRRVSREGESKVRSWFARLFYKLMNRISQTEIVDGAQDFRFMTRQMVDAVLSMSEYNRFSKGIFSWVGFRVKYLEYENVERVAGTSAWSFWGLVRYSLEGIIGFSTAPLTATAVIGFLSCLLGLILLLFTVIKKLAVGDPVAGYPTLICTILFFGGLQVFCTGILGLYLGKTYLEVKHRPIYLARETEEDAEKNLDAELPEASAADDEAGETLEKAKRLKAAADAEFDAVTGVSEAEDDEELSEDFDADDDFLDEIEDEEEAESEADDDEEAEAETEAAEPDETPDEAETDDDDTAAPAEAPAEEDDSEALSDEEPEAGLPDEDEDADEEVTEQDAGADDDEAEGEDDGIVARSISEPAAPKPKKEKFEVKIDYDSIDFSKDYDEDDADDNYDDDDYDDDDYDDNADYDDAEFDDEDAEDDEKLTLGERAAALWIVIKEKCTGLIEKIKSSHDTNDDEDDAPERPEPDDDDDDYDDGYGDAADAQDDPDYDEYDEDDYGESTYSGKHSADSDYDDDDDFDDEEDDSTYRGAHF